MPKEDLEQYLKQLKHGHPDQTAATFSLDDSGDSDSEVEQTGVKRRCVAVDEDPILDKADINIKLEDKLPSIRRKTLKLQVQSSQPYLQHVEEKVDSFITCDQSWATIAREDKEDESDDEVPSHLISKLPTQSVVQNQLDYTRVFNLNRNQKNKDKMGYVQAVHFHPTEPLAMVANQKHSVLNLFKVDGKNNPQVDSLELNEYPFECACFTPNGNTIIAGSKFHNYYVAYDIRTRTLETHQGPFDVKPQNLRRFDISPNGKMMVSANKHSVYFTSLNSLELFRRGHQDDQVRVLKFTPDGSLLFTYGDRGLVRAWDVRNFQILHTFQDRGAFNGNSIAFSPDSRFIALGSQRGGVNLYETKDALASTNPEPVKYFTNLVDHITTLNFNSTSQILGMASRFADDAVRLADIDTLSVYQNFPKCGKAINKVTALEFSPSSGYMAMGTSLGPVHLYRLKQYGSY